MRSQSRGRVQREQAERPRPGDLPLQDARCRLGDGQGSARRSSRLRSIFECMTNDDGCPGGLCLRDHQDGVADAEMNVRIALREAGITVEIGGAA